MTKKEQILEKAKKVQSKKIEKEQKYLNSLQEAVQKVKIALEKYDFNFECITSLEDLTHFVDFVTEKRDTLLAYDTETTGLNPVDDKAVGISFAALQNGEIKSIYIPFLHTKPISKELQENH